MLSWIEVKVTPQLSAGVTQITYYRQDRDSQLLHWQYKRTQQHRTAVEEVKCEVGSGFGL
jgi:hypothetical protein